MKSIVNVLICLLIANGSNALNKIVICGKIHSDQVFTVKIYEPILGYYNQASVESNIMPVIMLNDSFYYSFELLNEVPSFFSLSIIENKTGLPVNGRINILLCPGDSSHLSITPEVQDYDWVVFSGTNSFGHDLFQILIFNRVEIVSDIGILLKKLPEQKDKLFENVEKIEVHFSSLFKHLYDEQKISKEYFQSISKTVKMRLFEEIISRFLYSSYAQRLKIDKSFRDNFIAKLYEELDPLDPYIRPLWNSFIYINNYYLYRAYLITHSSFGDLGQDSTIKLNGINHLIDKTLAHLLFAKNPEIKEFLWATQIFAFFQLSPGLFDEEIVNQFDILFPNSKYSALLHDNYKLTTKIDRIQYTRLMPIEILNPISKYKSLNEVILSEFQGKAVYVDIWASWCGPCIASFSFNNTVDSFLLKNDIQRLYISLDADSSQWKTAINKYELGGTHMLADSFFVKDLKKILESPDNSGLAIPRYLIFDKSARLFNKDAPGPVNADLLFGEFTRADQ